MTRFRRVRGLPAWRKLALGTWDDPSSPTAYGVLDLECENALRWAARARAATGEKITLTHIVGKAAAIAIAAVPEANGFASFGRLMVRDSVDVFFQVAFFEEGEHPPDGHEARRDASLAGAKIGRADQKSIVEIARELRDRAGAIRGDTSDPTVRALRFLGRLPTPLRSPFVRVGAFLSFEMGVDLRGFGIPFDPFGSCMVTNVGVFGIEVALAPLHPYGRAPLCLTVGAVRAAPSVVGSDVLVRRRVSIGVAFDHRVMDGYHAGVMVRRFREVFADPDSGFGLAERAASAHALPSQ